MLTEPWSRGPSTGVFPRSCILRRAAIARPPAPIFEGGTRSTRGQARCCVATRRDALGAVCDSWSMSCVENVIESQGASTAPRKEKIVSRFAHLSILFLAVGLVSFAGTRMAAAGCGEDRMDQPASHEDTGSQTCTFDDAQGNTYTWTCPQRRVHTPDHRVCTSYPVWDRACEDNPGAPDVQPWSIDLFCGTTKSVSRAAGISGKRPSRTRRVPTARSPATTKAPGRSTWRIRPRIRPAAAARTRPCGGARSARPAAPCPQRWSDRERDGYALVAPDHPPLGLGRARHGQACRRRARRALDG